MGIKIGGSYIVFGRSGRRSSGIFLMQSWETKFVISIMRISARKFDRRCMKSGRRGRQSRSWWRRARSCWGTIIVPYRQYVSLLRYHLLINRGFDMSNKKLFLDDVRQHIPADIAREYHAGVANFILTHIMALHGYSFQYHSHRTLPSSPRRWPQDMARSNVYF